MSDAPANQKPWRAHLTRLLLVAGVALAAAQLVPIALQRDQTLRFDWRPAEPPVTEIDFTWRAAGDATVHGGGRISVAPDHRGPVVHRLHVPEGDYVLTVRLVRGAPASGPATTNFERRVSLQGDETTLLLHGLP